MDFCVCLRNTVKIEPITSKELPSLIVSSVGVRETHHLIFAMAPGREKSH